ncbi:MAG: NADP-dependent oxidoreductase [Phycisphaerales bacterium]|jgi:NADPH:quinone reductase-like Zn-dependent oxidoreductase
MRTSILLVSAVLGAGALVGWAAAMDPSAPASLASAPARPGAAPAAATPRPIAPPSVTAPTATETMKAVRLSAFGGPEVLTLADVPKPGLRKGEVLVRVVAAGVNPVDWKIRNGLLKAMGAPLPFTLGCDLSGEIVAVGEGVEDRKPGEAVFTFLPPMKTGSFAQFAVVPAATLAAKPAALDHVVAGSLPVAGLTAWQALFDHGGLKAGQTVLIQGAAGGVGHLAVQMAKHAGARVIATCSKENADFVKSLGADVVVDYKSQRFEDLAKDVDMVLDTIGGEMQQRSLTTLRRDGILVSIVQPPDAAKLKELGVRGAVFMVRADPKQLAEIAGLVVQGRIKPHIDATFPLAEFAKALERSEGGHTRGKLVLKMD